MQGLVRTDSHGERVTVHQLLSQVGRDGGVMQGGPLRALNTLGSRTIDARAEASQGALARWAGYAAVGKRRHALLE